DERKEDVGAIVPFDAALLVEPEERADAEVARLARPGEFEERAERGPAGDVGLRIVRVAEERPQLHVEGAGRCGAGEDRREGEPGEACDAGVTARSQGTSGPVPGSDTR